jgi:hypothetical protein
MSTFYSNKITIFSWLLKMSKRRSNKRKSYNKKALAAAGLVGLGTLGLARHQKRKR